VPAVAGSSASAGRHATSGLRGWGDNDQLDAAEPMLIVLVTMLLDVVTSLRLAPPLMNACLESGVNPTPIAPLATEKGSGRCG